MRQHMFGSRAINAATTDEINAAGGLAYAMTAKHELAQYATTGTFGDTYYVSGQDQLGRMKELVTQVDEEFIAKLAVYARKDGYMKDMPAFLCAALSTTPAGVQLLRHIFPTVINNGKMLRNYVQAIRSGHLGRKSLGSAPKKLIQDWLTNRPARALFNDCIGTRPSIADIIKMVHPTPKNTTQEAFYGYIIGKPYEKSFLPEIVQRYEEFKAGVTSEVPNVEFRYLTSLPLSGTVWTEIAKNAPWQMTRMNLNTFARHGVFEDRDMINTIAARLRNHEAIAGANVFPFQLLSAYRATENNYDIPHEVREALQDAVDLSVTKVPSFSDKQVVLCPDTSGSMGSPIFDQSERGRVRDYDSLPLCIDVAGLVTSAFLRCNPESRVLPFATDVHTSAKLNPRDTLTTNTTKLRRLGGGGTNCSAPLAKMNREGIKADLVIFISDYESWMDSEGRSRYNGTAMATEWLKFKGRNPEAKLVCIDCAPTRTIQAPDKSHDIINIGGFSDIVFDITRKFVDGTLDANHWVGLIEETQLG